MPFMGPSAEVVVRVTRLRDAISEAQLDAAVPDSLKMVLQYLDELTNKDIPRV